VLNARKEYKTGSQRYSSPWVFVSDKLKESGYTATPLQCERRYDSHLRLLAAGLSFKIDWTPSLVRF